MNSKAVKSTLKSACFVERDHRNEISNRHSLPLHGFGLGTIMVIVTWLTSHLLLIAGVSSMAVRYAVALMLGYGVYVLLLRAWAGRLASANQNVKDDDSWSDSIEILTDGMDALGTFGGSRQASSAASFSSGGGGDFGGGGTTASFDITKVSDGFGDVAGSALKGAGKAVGDTDEGSVIVIPVVAIFLIATFSLLGIGSFVFLYFGSEALLTVAVEIAFSYAATKAATKIARKGWLGSVLEITWKPLLGALLCAIVVGFALDTLFPQSNSFPDAWSKMHASKIEKK